MPFAVEDFHDLLRLLEAHPEWRADLRRVVLTESLLALPDAVNALTQQVAALAEAQARTETKLAALAEQMALLAAAQQRTEHRVDELVGFAMEQRFVRHAAAHLGTLGLRRSRVLTPDAVAELADDGVDADRITMEQRADLLRADAVVRARDGDGEVWLAVEVSMVVEPSDINRARERAKILGLLQPRARACVAGRSFTATAEKVLASSPAIVAITLEGT